MRSVFYLYISSSFLLHALSPVPLFSFGFWLSSGAYICACLSGRRWSDRTSFTIDDRWLFIVYLLGIAPLAWAPYSLGLNNAIYTVLWPIVFFICSYWPRIWAIKSGASATGVSQSATWGLAVLSISVCLEFITANVYGKFISDFIPFSTDQFPFALALEERYIRPRGFSTEGGFTAMAIEFLLPLAAITAKARPAFTAVTFTLAIPAYLLLFSGASIICLGITCVIYLLAFKRNAYVKIIALASALFLLFLLVEPFRYWIYEIAGRKLAEFSIEEQANAQGASRPEAYALGLGALAAHPLGLGWGAISQCMASGTPIAGILPKGSGLISIPLEVAVSGGFFAFAVAIGVLIAKLRRLVICNSRASRCVFFSLLWVSLHHCVILELWFPMIWAAMALSDVIGRTRRPMLHHISGNWQ